MSLWCDEWICHGQAIARPSLGRQHSPEVPFMIALLFGSAWLLLVLFSLFHAYTCHDDSSS